MKLLSLVSNHEVTVDVFFFFFNLKELEGAICDMISLLDIVVLHTATNQLAARLLV